jgi:hypothetical protein
MNGGKGPPPHGAAYVPERTNVSSAINYMLPPDLLYNKMIGRYPSPCVPMIPSLAGDASGRPMTLSAPSVNGLYPPSMYSMPHNYMRGLEAVPPLPSEISTTRSGKAALVPSKKRSSTLSGEYITPNIRLISNGNFLIQAICKINIPLFPTITNYTLTQAQVQLPVKV